MIALVRPRAVSVTATLGVLAAAVAAGLMSTFNPKATLLAFIALLVVGVALLRVHVAILGLVATGPLENALAPDAFPVSITKAAGALCFASFALYAARPGRRLRFESGQAIVLGLLAVALVSMLQARDAAAAMTTTSRYASFAALYLVLTQFARDHLLLRRIAWVLSAASAVASVLALRDYFAGRNAVASLLYANPSDFAFMLATTLPLTFWLLGHKSRLRPLVVLLIGLVSAAVLLSLSRGALAGLAAGLAFLLLTERQRFRIIVGGGVVAATAALLAIQNDPGRFESALVLKERVAEYNVTTRFDAWQAAARLTADHPLLGVGPGNFQDRFLEATNRPPGTHNLGVAHNAYLDVGAELGLPGLVLFLAFIALVFARLSALARRGVGPPGYAAALRIALVVAAVCAIFLSEQYFLPFWLIGGLATALWLEVRETAAPETLVPRVVPALEAPEVEPSARAQPDYDLRMRTARLEQRERRVKATFEAIRMRQVRLSEHEAAIEAGLSELNRTRRELAETGRAFAAATSALEREKQKAARVEAELGERRAALDDRIRELEERERRLNDEVAAQAAALAEEKIAPRLDELAAQGAGLDRRGRELDETDRALVSRQSGLQAREEKSERREQLISEREAELRRRSRELRDLTRKLERDGGSLQKQRARLERLAEELTTRKRELDKREAEARTLSRTLSAREASLARRERRLAAATGAEGKAPDEETRRRSPRR